MRKKNVKDFNLLIIKWIQTNDITPENTRKKDLTVTEETFKGRSKNSEFRFLPFLVFSVSVAFHLFLVSFCQVSSVT